MTTTQRDALVSPRTGSIIYNTTSNSYNYYDGSTWKAIGSGAAGGTGDDLDALLYRASFNETFADAPTVSTSSVQSSGTNATYNTANALFSIAYDATKTVTGTGTSMTLSGAPGFTIAAGDVLIVGTQAKKITALASQTSITIESAFSSNPSGAACTVSQTVHTKDVYNFAVDGSALSAAFGGATFSEILVDYKDAAASTFFVPNVAPVVGYSASPDGTAFSAVTVRATNETDRLSVLTLPSAGTQLWLRFFANKTSGSGTVKLIAYKAFMQKDTSVAPAGGVVNQAYGLTNGAGTPVNCTIAVIGGKTQITLTNFTYPVGANPGSPYGALDVFLNGQLLPRFIDGTTTADSSYTETSPTIVTLDKDYSGLSVAVEILQRVAVIDASTVNTTMISGLQEVQAQGFQNFVYTGNVMTPTTTPGTPAAGTFYSSIGNRAPIADLTADLKARIGIERVTAEYITQLEAEVGPNGEPVFALVNDDRGVIRFVGSNWGNLIDPNGPRPYTGATTTSTAEYVEITFFGTGLNMLGLPYNSANDFRYTVDGGAESANFAGANYGRPYDSRFYAWNVVVPVVSGLTLGVHTVKIRKAGSGANTDLNFYGYEILNDSSSVKVQPGQAYAGGKKIAVAAQASLVLGSGYTNAYGTPGTRGGRVLVYADAAGNVKKDIQYTGTSTQFLTSVDHSIEEVARVYFPREFGVDRGDDFSQGLTTTTRAFTLDDGTATLTSSSGVFAQNNGVEGLGWGGGAGTTITLTFVGTGVDVVFNNTSFIGTITAQIDGVTSGTVTLGANGNNLVKIASWLPYGTHVLKLTLTAITSGLLYLNKFVVYQPKKPALPSGAFEIADYNLMATFVANNTAGIETISTGVLRKNLASREALYVEGSGGTQSWSPGTINTSQVLNGWESFSDRSGASVQYTFFGTGFDWRYFGSANRSTNVSITVDGLALTVANFASLSASTYGGGSLNAGTGVFAQSTSTTSGCGLVVTGLPLGVHTVKFTNNTASSFLVVEALDVITPVYSMKRNLFSDFQNTLPVGSNSLSDNRQTSPVKDLLPEKRASAQAVGVASSPTTTSTAQIPMPDMSVTVKTSGGALRIMYMTQVHVTNSANSVNATVVVDGIFVGGGSSYEAFTNDTDATLNGFIKVPVSPGIHKVDVYWNSSSGGTVRVSGVSRFLLVEET
jgi:hypothetical protein